MSVKSGTKSKQRDQITVRLSPRHDTMLDEICRRDDTNPSDYLRACIERDHVDPVANHVNDMAARLNINPEELIGRMVMEYNVVDGVLSHVGTDYNIIDDGLEISGRVTA